MPSHVSFSSWGKAWNAACTGTDCSGLKPYFMNSVMMVVPAVAISTSIGIVNGYVLSKWRFRGSEVMFAMMLFGVFMPMQVVLLPMSQVLGYFGIASSIVGLIVMHVLAGIRRRRCSSATTTSACLPDEPDQGRHARWRVASGASSGASYCRCRRPSSW